MLHGFSRGSANSYAVMALDAGKGTGFFALAVAQSGGVSVDYRPTRAILNGEYGSRPLAGTKWITVAGMRDPQPDQGGVPAMRRTAIWLREQGAEVDSIEVMNGGHGALTRDSATAAKVLDRFLH